MNKREQRLSQIEEYVNRHKIVSTSNMARLFDVAYMTIHRDLKTLASQNRLGLMRGVALANDTDATSPQYQFQEERYSHREEKRRIGEQAAKLVEEEDVIILDAGTTTEAVARAIDPTLRITVISHALNVINFVAANTSWNLIVPGGQYHRHSPLFESHMACEYLRSMQATKAFLSASGVSAKLGVTSKNMFEVEIKQTIMQSSDRRVLVADSSKFDHVFAAHFAELSDFETLVTDHLFSDPQAEQLNQVDVELIRA